MQTSELIWRTNYHGNERREESRVGDSGLEDQNVEEGMDNGGEEEKAMDNRGRKCTCGCEG